MSWMLQSLQIPAVWLHHHPLCRVDSVHLLKYADSAWFGFLICLQIRYDTRCYFNVRSKADLSQLNLPHGIWIWIFIERFRRMLSVSFAVCVASDWEISGPAVAIDAAVYTTIWDIYVYSKAECLFWHIDRLESSLYIWGRRRTRCTVTTAPMGRRYTTLTAAASTV